MITSIHIRNIGIIEDLNIDFGPNFNVLTGETGAGKTLIIDALKILAGGRFSKEIIRTGEDYSFVEASLNLENNEDSVIVSREINLSGKNVCKINGRMVNVNDLREFMLNIIDIHGQHDNQSILDSQMHIQFLDRFAGDTLLKLKEQYLKLYIHWNGLKKDLEEHFGDDKEKQRRLDLLKYQLEEIENANLKIGEDERLEAQRKLMLNSETISENLASANYQLSEVSLDSINIAKRNLEKIENLDSKYSENLKNIQELYYNLEELARDIADLQSEIYFDENERQQTEERLDLIFSLKRKYGNSIEEILNYAEDLKKEISKLENIEEYNNNLKEEISKVQVEMLKISKQLHKLRMETAKKLDKNITEQLVDLEMVNAKFKTDIVWSTEETYNKNGLDKVEFLIATNVGDTYKPLIKIASGGELSRIMLGIKTVLADIDQVPVLVFDEIDTGISGIAANKVGEKLKLIAQKHQVICITHLAVIAAKGDDNFYISKEVINEQTKTHIKKLNEEEIINEIARIASGEQTEVALAHAKALRES